MSLKSENISNQHVISNADNMHEDYDGDLPDNSSAVPFRFAVNGPFNIRKQPTNNHYKTFIGEQKA